VFGISGTELFIIGVFAIIIFGPDKLPALGRTVGRFMKEFKKVQGDVEAMIRTEMAAAETDSKTPAEGTVAAERGMEGDAPAIVPPTPAQTFGDDADDEEEEEE